MPGLQLLVILVESFLSFSPKLISENSISRHPFYPHKSNANYISSHTSSQISLPETKFRYVTSASQIFLSNLREFLHNMAYSCLSICMSYLDFSVPVLHFICIMNFAVAVLSLYTVMANPSVIVILSP